MRREEEGRRKEEEGRRKGEEGRRKGGGRREERERNERTSHSSMVPTDSPVI